MLKLEIVTPEKKVLDETVDSVTVPTLTGQAGILPSHAPLISALKPGVLTYSNKGTNGKFVTEPLPVTKRIRLQPAPIWPAPIMPTDLMSMAESLQMKALER